MIVGNIHNRLSLKKKKKKKIIRGVFMKSKRPYLHQNLNFIFNIYCNCFLPFALLCFDTGCAQENN